MSSLSEPRSNFGSPLPSGVRRRLELDEGLAQEHGPGVDQHRAGLLVLREYVRDGDDGGADVRVGGAAQRVARVEPESHVLLDELEAVEMPGDFDDAVLRPDAHVPTELAADRRRVLDGGDIDVLLAQPLRVDEHADPAVVAVHEEGEHAAVAVAVLRQRFDGRRLFLGLRGGRLFTSGVAAFNQHHGQSGQGRVSPFTDHLFLLLHDPSVQEPGADLPCQPRWCRWPASPEARGGLCGGHGDPTRR